MARATTAAPPATALEALDAEYAALISERNALEAQVNEALATSDPEAPVREWIARLREVKAGIEDIETERTRRAEAAEAQRIEECRNRHKAAVEAYHDTHTRAAGVGRDIVKLLGKLDLQFVKLDDLQREETAAICEASSSNIAAGGGLTKEAMWGGISGETGIPPRILAGIREAVRIAGSTPDAKNTCLADSWRVN